MNIREISKSVHYIGVNHRNLERFESLWPLPYGVSYNSYLVTGADKIAIIDGVEVSFGLEQIRNIKKLLGDRKPDYVVINHMEPDHSGGISVLRAEWPDITIVGNAQTLGMVKGYYGEEGNTLAVKDGQVLEMGGISLRFITTPMVHWPETMMTYLQEEGVLFTGDACGCFGALNGGVTDREMDTDWYFPEMVRYYSNIVGKYGAFVQKALAKLQGIEPMAICSTHGPVWMDRIGEVLDLYDRLSRYEPLDKEGVTIIFGSMYGNTQNLAEAVAEGLAEGGIRNIKIYNAAKAELSQLLAESFRNRGLVVAAPTYSEKVFPPVQSYLTAIETRGLKNRVTAALGSFTWVAKAGPAIQSQLEGMGLAPIAPAVLMKQGLSEEVREQARNLGLTLAHNLLAEPVAESAGE